MNSIADRYATQILCALLVSVAALWLVGREFSAAAVVMLVSTGVAVLWLSAHPLRVQPGDDLPLVLSAALVAFALGPVPFAVAGLLLGLSATLVTHQVGRQDPGPVAVEGVALTGAALSTIPLWTSGAVLPLDTLWIAAGVYVAIRVILVTIRIRKTDVVGWGRMLAVTGTTTVLHLIVPVALTLLTVMVERVWFATTNRFILSALPLLSGAVVLQLFQPSSLRRREEHRVVAITAMLANAIDVKDAATGLHSQAVAMLSRRLARAIGVSETLAHQAYLAGLLHDVGKVSVPDDILLKPGPLSGSEWQVMQRHVVASEKIVSTIAGLSAIVPLVRASHEHYDGAGYPDGLRGRAIPLGARIVAIADAFHALTHDRAYRNRRDLEGALEELDRASGTQFDPGLVLALHSIVGRPSAKLAGDSRAIPIWLALLKRPSFALLWGGELVSFLGDEVFFIAITLWIYTLTRSATLLAATLAAGYASQALFGVVAGAVADRVDRRGVIAASDLVRAATVAALPFVLVRSIPATFGLLIVLNIASAFFRAAVSALLPSLVSRDELAPANALMQTTERIAEVLGGVLGAGAVLTIGYGGVMWADAGSFLVSAGCVLLMPLAWRAGLGRHRSPVRVQMLAGVRYMWRLPFQRYFAFLIVPGYLTLAFAGLQAPMLMRTAHLPVTAYGIINSVAGLGRLAAAVFLSTITIKWATPGAAVGAYLLAALGAAMFAATPWYLWLIAGTFVYAVGNMLTFVANSTVVMERTPHHLLGRVLGNRQALVQATRVVAVLGLGRVADVINPPTALWVMVVLTVGGVLGAWILFGRTAETHEQRDMTADNVTYQIVERDILEPLPASPPSVGP